MLKKKRGNCYQNNQSGLLGIFLSSGFVGQQTGITRMGFRYVYSSFLTATSFSFP